MAKKKEQSPTPIGFTAKAESSPLITFQQFFDLMRAVDAINNIVNFVKSENFNADNIRYYFPDDLIDKEEIVDGFDENGNPGKVKKTIKVLREDFWEPKKEEIVNGQ